MQLSPEVRRFLDKLGVNTTRLQWKLYELEKRRARGVKFQLPARLNWLRYKHKLCGKCGAVVDRDDVVCPRCTARVPSIATYRILRMLGLVLPKFDAPVVGGFLVAIVAVYLLTCLVGGAASLFMPSQLTLITVGAWNGLYVHEAGQYWRMMSFGLVHIGLLHILFNGMALTQVGPLIEAQTGRAKMLVVITLTQLASAVATDYWYLHVLEFPQAVSAGASGWLFGLLGYGIGYFHYIGVRTHSYRNFFIQWAVYGIVFGWLIGANNAAHVGGMIAGILLGLVPDQHPQYRNMLRPVWPVAAWICGAMWILAIGFATHFAVMTLLARAAQ